MCNIYGLRECVCWAVAQLRGCNLPPPTAHRRDQRVFHVFSPSRTLLTKSLKLAPPSKLASSETSTDYFTERVRREPILGAVKALQSKEGRASRYFVVARASKVSPRVRPRWPRSSLLGSVPHLIRNDCHKAVHGVHEEAVPEATLRHSFYSTAHDCFDHEFNSAYDRRRPADHCLLHEINLILLNLT